MPFAPFDPAAMRGQVALITGAGGGIGTALARRFAGLGMRLVLTDLRTEALERTAAGLDTELLLRTGNLAEEEVVRGLFAAALERFGRLDAAVNAAGLLRQVPIDQITKADWDATMDANLGSAFLVCRECCAPMKRQGSGRIVNFASLAAHVGGIVAGAHYAASKAGVISLTRSVAKYLAPYGVRCNAVAPSGVETEMLWQFGEEKIEMLRQGIPVGRFASPEEIAELVLWLCSPATDYITGQTININGGAYLG